MNWFIGFPVPAEGWFPVVSPPPDIRLLHPADLHLTAAFLGPVSEEQARAAWATVPPHGPFDVTLGAVVPMGRPKRYSALAVELADGREPVEAAMAAVQSLALPAAGRPPSRFEPRAHITLARPRRSASRAAREAGLAWAAGLHLDAALRLDTLGLFVRDPSGPPFYRRVA